MWDVKSLIHKKVKQWFKSFTLTMWDVKTGNIKLCFTKETCFTLTMWDVKVTTPATTAKSKIVLP